MATILLVGVDLFFRGKLEGLLPGHRLVTSDSVAAPDVVIAVAWGVFMAINLIWPRKDVYNATEPFHWYLQYGAVLFIGIVFFGGLAYYWFVQRHKTGVLASHAHTPAADPVATPTN